MLLSLGLWTGFYPHVMPCLSPEREPQPQSSIKVNPEDEAKAGYLFIYCEQFVSNDSERILSMGFYSQVIFPNLLDWTMSDPHFSGYRKEVLSEVSGNVLEIGFGTGLNLQYYPNHLEKLTTIDANPGMNAKAQKRIQDSSIQVDYKVLNGENLPMADNSFDSVVSTWTLCSITNVDQALQQIHRVLKPGGKFFFIEHGLSDDPNAQVWQNRLTPVQKVIADGCHLNRNMEQLVKKYFQTLTMEKFYVPKTPKFFGYMYKGVATKG
jgi:ubiquinone/menaquinone biosynthesis C-methylase UbiE